MSLSHSCLEGPLDILVPLTQLIVRRILWTSWNPPFMSPQAQVTCCLEDPLDIPGSSLVVPSDTSPHAVQRIPWTSQDPPFVSLQTQRPPRCPEDPLDIPGSSFGFRSHGWEEMMFQQPRFLNSACQKKLSRNTREGLRWRYL